MVSGDADMSDKIKVAVRVRPFNRRELELKTECVVTMDTNQTVLHHPSDQASGTKDSRKPPKSFAFDHCFNSYLDPDNDPNFASQNKVFQALGVDILDNAFEGYNACIFAYGQTGSGKSYTMLGSPDCQGIIPRLCDSLFARILEKQNKCDANTWQAKVEVSYMEIYNERVFDLLDPKTSGRQGLKVREHSVLGPYVDGLSQLAVVSYQEIADLMMEGNKSRTVASTYMNNESSRSHAVFTIVLTQTLTDERTAVSGEKVSRISLVDLAGSERAVKTGAVGDRLKEGSNINKSLTTLGLVISKLADRAGSGGGKNKKDFVPYRDSTLTWLLKDNLGGNSRTVMVATISPAADNYEETLSTLRYADRAKRIVNHAVVNEDPNARIIRELRAEVDALKEMLKHATQPEVLREKLSENEKLMKEISLTWEEKLQKTGQTQEDRRNALEKIGVSVGSSGIKVEKDKYFLVNLNSDPALNELLVYYLKDENRVGRAEDPLDPDIQLSGAGIQSQHCIIRIDNGNLLLEPLKGARTCVNGVEIKETTRLRNGDRILWGSNHFFRVNCPKSSNSDPTTPAVPFDWTMAQEEVMKADLSNDPIATAISRLERQYEEEKQNALEKQRLEFERQMKNFMSPSTPYPQFMSVDPLRNSYMRQSMSSSMSMSKIEKWTRDRDETFKRSLARLRESLFFANNLAREANLLAEELGKATRFSVTLQIPPYNLSPNRNRRAFPSEPAILVKRSTKTNRVWSVEKLESKLVEMRLMASGDMDSYIESGDPFVDENTETHELIGVANVFLNCLFHDIVFEYQTPIISQQGEVSGRLQVRLQRVSGTMFAQDRYGHCGSVSSSSENSSDLSKLSSGDVLSEADSSHAVIKVSIIQATGLPPALSHFVFCQYAFWGLDPDSVILVPPAVPDDPVSDSLFQNGHSSRSKDEETQSAFKFNHEQEFCVHLSEEFIEHCSEGALSIEVYGNRVTGIGQSGSQSSWSEVQQQAKARSLADRWSELTRKLQLDVEVQELNDSGEYTSVEVQPSAEVGTGGVYQLRQGQQRRIMVSVLPLGQNSGSLPLVCAGIISVSAGAPCVRSKLQKPLDSYQEDDLNQLRRRWSEALGRRREHLDEQIQKYINKHDKTESEAEREQSLVDQWVSLTEERNSVMVPDPGSGVPGAPADWDPPDGMEIHSPVLFLNLNEDDLSSGYCEDGDIPVYGHNSILPKEHGGKFFNLPIIAFLDEPDVGAIATWDSSIHDSLCLNRITPNNERAYLIVKTIVRVSHPTSMDIVLRKRICFNVYKRHSITDKIRRKMGHTSQQTSTAVIYEIVSNIPKASEELEDRESLAVMAASGFQESNPVDDNEANSDSKGPEGTKSFIEQYTKGISAVENILALDQMRQNVAVKELLKLKNQSTGFTTPSGSSNSGMSQSQIMMRKTVSVPNFSQVTNSVSLQDISSLIRSSESFCGDLNEEMASLIRQQQQGQDHDGAKAGGHFGSSPGMKILSQAAAKPMSTLAEEEDAVAEEDDQNELQPKVEQSTRSVPASSCSTSTSSTSTTGTKANNLSTVSLSSAVSSTSSASTTTSSTVSATITSSGPLASTIAKSSVANAATPSNTASVGSSGYSSQPLSWNTLSSDDSLSVRSISADATPDTEIAATPHDSTDLVENRQHHVKADDGSSTTLSDESASMESSVESIKLEKLPTWIAVGESVQVKPGYSSGVIAFIGATEFASGIWIGVELDAPTGKNDGSVHGVRYFNCQPKRGVFVRPDKVQLDKRGRLIRQSQSHKGKGYSAMTSSKSSSSLSTTSKSNLSSRRQTPS